MITENMPLPYGPLGIITTVGIEEFANNVNDYLVSWRKEVYADEIYGNTFSFIDGHNHMIDTECIRFTTGEGKGIINESVRGYDLYIFCDVTNDSCTFNMKGKEVPMSPDNYFQDLKRLIGAVAGKAERINVIMPYLYQGRQDNRRRRESLDCAMALKELEALGVSNIITFDSHEPRVANSIPIMGFENIFPTYQVLKALFRNIHDLEVDKKSMIVVSPDEGAINRNLYYSTVMGLDLGVFVKRRDYNVVENGRNPIIAHEYLGDSVEGKDVFIADDIIATGDSVLDLVYKLKERKARRIIISSTFGLFTDNESIDLFDKAFNEGALTAVITTNLSHIQDRIKNSPWHITADVSKYMAFIVATLNHNISMASLMDPTDKIKRLLNDYKRKQ